MYDPLETDISYEYMLKLRDKLTKLEFAVLGGWAVFFHVRKTYQQAFGKEYVRSRDIDVFIDAKHEEEFLKIIKSMGFKESAYKFRYELIYDREQKTIIATEESKKKHIFSLIYIFLDVFSNKETKKLGSWAMPLLSKAKIVSIEGLPVLDIQTLLSLKTASFFERDKLDKELKDACDIYALLFYSGEKIKADLSIRKAAEKIISRADLQEYIAEHVLEDRLKASLVVSALRALLKH